MSTIRSRELVCYGLGDAAFALVGTLIAYFQVYFFTDIFGIAPTALAAMMFVTRAWDTINDPIMGLVADRTRSRFGRYRPWIVFSILPFAVVSILMFTVPSDFGGNGKLAYAYAICLLYGTVHTAINISYMSLMSSISLDDKIRSQLASAKFIGAFLASALAMYFTRDLVSFFGQGDDTKGYTSTASVYAIVSSVLLSLTFFGTRERVQHERTTHKQISAEVRSMVTNRPLLIAMAASVFIAMFSTIKNNMTIYYLIYVVQKPEIERYFMAGGIVSCLAGVIAISAIIKKVDKKKLFIFLISGSAVFIGAMYWANPESHLLLSVFHCINSFLGGASAPVMFSIYADIVDFSDWRSRYRSPGLISAAAIFSGKMGGSIAGLIVPLSLAMTQYTPNQEQTDIAKESITVMFTLLPAAIALLASLCMAFYPLTDNKVFIIGKFLRIKRYN